MVDREGVNIYMAKSQQDKIIDTIRENYVSAIIGLIIVILGIGYIYSTIKARNATQDLAKQENSQNFNQQDTISGRTYKVQKGDTLWSIAERKYQSGYNFSDIVTANKLKNQNTLEIGQNLILPDVPSKKITVGLITPTVAKVAPTVVPTRDVLPTKATVKTTPKAPITINGTSYTIIRGDNLWSIAVRAYGDGYKWTEIWKANKKMISNPNLIYAGNKLVLPR